MPKRPQLLVQRGRALRDAQTDAEATLWRALRNRQVEGFKFRRQHAIGPYIADFVCLEVALVLELDGGQHADAAIEDAKRTAYLQAQGYGVLRFWNNDVLGNLEGVLEVIRRELLNAAPLPQPSGEAPALRYPQRGEGDAVLAGASVPLTPALSPEGRGGKAASASPRGRKAGVDSSSPSGRGGKAEVHTASPKGSGGKAEAGSSSPKAGEGECGPMLSKWKGGEVPADLSPLPSGERVRVRGRESPPSLFSSRKHASVKGQH
ncbi:MAG: endonuclease domain-containing protein [Pseudomonadota bacterium]